MSDKDKLNCVMAVNKETIATIEGALANVNEDTLRELIVCLLDRYNVTFDSTYKPTPEQTEYNVPKKTSKKRKTETGASTSIPIKNPYDVLSDTSDDERMEHETAAEQQENNTVTDKTNPSSISKKIHSPKYNSAPKNQVNEAKNKVAPIIIRETAKWTQISKLMKMKNINAAKSKVISTGIQVEPLTEDDYRSLSKLLKEQNIQYYTYQLKSEKKLKIVLRGVPQDITDDEVTLDLKEKDYPIEKITRMKGKNGHPAPLVLIEIGRDYKSIYNLKECCGLDIKVESLRTRTEIVQCHKCQLFGHTQSNCNIDFRCMKCGEEHSTHLCTKPKTTPPKCANCSGEHLSTFIKCPQNPNNVTTRKFLEAPVPKENPWFKKREEQKTDNKPRNTPDNKDEQLSNILGRMIMNFNKTKSTQEQQLQFLQQTREITAIFNS